MACSIVPSPSESPTPSRARTRRRAADGAAPPTPLPGDLAAICADAEARVVAYTGLRPAAPLPAPEAVQRPGLDRGERQLDGRDARPDRRQARRRRRCSAAPTRAAAGVLLSVEAGALTGYLSQRVLGQYEFALVDPDAPARLLFVAPNIAAGGARAWTPTPSSC